MPKNEQYLPPTTNPKSIIAFRQQDYVQKRLGPQQQQQQRQSYLRRQRLFFSSSQMYIVHVTSVFAFIFKALLRNDNRA